MLRASAKAAGMTVDLRAVVDSKIDSGIPSGSEILAFADTVTGNNVVALSVARADLRRVLGPGALAQSAAIAANFSMNDRAANAIGIVLESMFVRDSVDYRAALGIDNYPSALNSLKPK